MFFRNKKTGHIWEIVDEDHIQRLKNNPDYEVVEVKKQEEEKQTAKKSPKKKG